MKNQKSISIFVLISGLFIEIFLIVFTHFNRQNGNIPLFMFLYLETFLIMLVTFFFIRKLSKNKTGKPKKIPWLIRTLAKILSFNEEDADKLRTPLLIISWGIIFRLTLFPAAYATSPDVNRYLWEGKILYHGYNPFTISPADTQLARFRNKVYENINFKNMQTIYPPLAQLTFLSAYLIKEESTQGLKILYLAFDLMILFLLLKLLYLKKSDLNNIILYAWMPLILLEFYVNAHIDIAGIFFMLLFIFLMEKDRPIWASLPFALAILTKMYPVILFPLVLKRMDRKTFYRFFFNFILIVMVFYTPFIYKDYSVFTSLITYLKKWEFNSSVYYLLKHNFFSPENSRLICAGLFIITVGLISYFYKDFTKAAYGIFIALIIFSTTLYPWYLGWIAALNPLYNFYSVTSLLFTINFSNFTPLGTVWKEYLFVLLLQYIPFFTLLLIDLLIMWKKKKIVEKTQ